MRSVCVHLALTAIGHRCSTDAKYKEGLHHDCSLAESKAAPKLGEARQSKLYFLFEYIYTTAVILRAGQIQI